MRNFRITVNDTVYDVAVEELGGAAVPVAAATAAPVAAAPAPAAKAPTAATSGQKVTAPMPGKVFDIKVAEGDKVGKGQAVLILEAMKMENEIVSPVDGTIEKIVVSKGQSVESGDLLLSIV